MEDYVVQHQEPLTVFEYALINNFQRDFPLQLQPYDVLATCMGCSKTEIFSHLKSLQQRGIISRVGAIFRPNTVGVSTLAALAVPKGRLDEVANHISARAEINHNYEREHYYNLWFVATAESLNELTVFLQDLESECQCGALLILPMLEEFYIDLGFNLNETLNSPAYDYQVSTQVSVNTQSLALSTEERTLLAALQKGLPFEKYPFATLGVDETFAIETLQRWLQQGVIKRFGIIVRHHELGYKANAMVVLDIPDQSVQNIGAAIARSGKVSLCYRRPRQLPHWPYNLFCMVHGKTRSEVEAHIRQMLELFELKNYSCEILFSLRRFKQRGAHYMHSKASVRHSTLGNSYG
jgi:DNA-binding Lrp family transcriptional regulator